MPPDGKFALEVEDAGWGPSVSEGERSAGCSWAAPGPRFSARAVNRGWLGPVGSFQISFYLNTFSVLKFFYTI